MVEIDMDGWDLLIESTIDSIRVDSDYKEVWIDVTCAWEGKDRKRIVATGVDDFVVNEMRLLNVVDRVSRFDANHIKDDSDEIARRLFFLMQGREPSSSDLEWPSLRENLIRIQEGALCLLDVEPVYGAKILILAEDFRLETVP